MTPRIAAKGLIRRYGTRVAVDGVSFEAARGEVLGFLGPNGAGKTTLFQMLAGLMRPDAGSIEVDGRPAPPTDPKVRARWGVVFQSSSLDDRLTARENLRLSAALYSVPRAEARARSDELLARTELTERAGDRVQTFSGGMKRRLELARALIHRPEILVMDEPTQGLDQASFQSLWRYVLARKAEGLTVLVTTHRPEEAEHADRIAVIDQGKVVAIDTPAALKKRVGGDVIVLEGDDPDGLARDVRRAVPAEPRVVGGAVTLELARGHEVIPRIVEALPPGRLRGVSLRPPSLGDVFLALTGKGLQERERAA